MKHTAGFKREKELQKQLYFNDMYFDKTQLFSMSEQINLLYRYSKNFKNAKILEIGKGNGFVSDFFKKAKFDYKTFDINENLEPDIVGNILELNQLIPFSSDIILCAEVLEHMDFKHFNASVEQLSLVSKKYVIITLPEFKRFFGAHFRVNLPIIKHFSFSLFAKTKYTKLLPEEHFWEIDYSDASSRLNIESIFKNHFSIIEKGCFHTNPYHNYYVLETLNPSSNSH